MRYMLLIYGDEQALDEAGRQECYEESTQLTQDLHAAGQYLAASPLQPTSSATSVRVRDGKRLVTDGPFAETREQLGGYFMIEANDLDEAIAVAARIPMARSGIVEVRPAIDLPGLPTGAAEPGSGDRELSVSRVLDAPRDMVFRAWTEPERLARWWGPHGMTTPVCEIEARAGGLFRTVMRDPAGTEYPHQGVFLEVRAPERIVFTDAFAEAWKPSSKPFMTAVVTFEDLGGRTRNTARALHWSVADRVAHEQMGFQKGWGEMLERLAACLTEP